MNGIIPTSEILDAVAPHTDILERSTLQAFLRLFVLAHGRTPGGVSLEIGTRSGGSALMWAMALEHLYDRPPLLVTVDPYGEKAYPAGLIDPLEYKYGEENYLAARGLLVSYANHFHFGLTSEDFWKLEGSPVWQGGKQSSLTDLTFAFLDGDHSPAAVLVDAAHIVKNLRPGGILLIDNVNWVIDIGEVLAFLAPVVKRDTRWAAFQK